MGSRVDRDPSAMEFNQDLIFTKANHPPKAVPIGQALLQRGIMTP